MQTSFHPWNICLSRMTRNYRRKQSVHLSITDTMRTLLVFGVLVASLQTTTGARILGIVPTPSISHQLPFRLVMQALHARGHEITVVTTDPMKRNLTNYTEIDLSFMYDYWRSTFDFTSMVEMTPYEVLDATLPAALMMSDMEMSSPQLEQLRKSNQTFDLIIIEAIQYQCFYGFQHVFGSPPMVGYLSLGMLSTTHEQVGYPDNPAYISDCTWPYTDHLSLWERANNAYYQNKLLGIWHDSVLPDQEKCLRKYFGPEPPPIIEVQNNFSLFLANNHWTMNYPRAFVPNVVELTGLHIEQTRKPLQEDIKNFIEGAKDGVIYFSLGTNVNASTMPEEKRLVFLAAFSELPQRVLWKWESGSMNGTPKNVMVSKWFPQQDVISHPKVKLFMTQGGLQSLNEAGYFGVPMVVIPFIADQGFNAAKMAQVGMAVKLEFKNVTKASVLWAIKSVLDNPRFKIAAEKFSSMYKEAQQKSLDEAVWWVEYVIRHKGASHLRSAAVGHSWRHDITFHSVLLLAFYIGIATVLSKLILFIFRRIKKEK